MRNNQWPAWGRIRSSKADGVGKGEIRLNPETRNRIRNHSDEELLQMLYEASDYEPEAISYAQEEMALRGGSDVLFAKIAARQHESQMLKPLEGSEGKISNAWGMALISVFINSVLVILSFFGLGLLGVDAWSLFDIAIVLVLAYGVYRKSRVCAILLLMVFVSNAVYGILNGQRFRGVGALFIWLFIQGVVGTFRYHSFISKHGEYLHLPTQTEGFISDQTEHQNSIGVAMKSRSSSVNPVAAQELEPQDHYDQELIGQRGSLTTREETTSVSGFVLTKQKPKKQSRYLIVGILNLVISPLYALVFAARIDFISDRDFSPSQLLPALRPYFLAEYIIDAVVCGLVAMFMLLSGILLVRRRNTGRILAGLVMGLIVLFPINEIFFDFFVPLRFPMTSTVNGITYWISQDYKLTYFALGMTIFPVIGFLVVRKRIDAAAD